jgi:hypothetical protein
MSLSESIKAAIKTCIGKNILVSFLKRHSSEVENMLLSEWNMKDALEVAKEEAVDEVIELLENGMSLAEVKQKFSSESRNKP